jgi:short-subunit dehydrogenase
MFQDKVIIVTGASEGIGRALCLALAPHKPKLVIAARNENRLKDLKAEIESHAGQALVVPTDVSEEDACKNLEQIMRVNYFGAAYCTYYALPHLKQSKGRIAAVSSVAGLTGVPTRSAYCASKHAMFGFFDALRVELMDSGVTVTMIAPDFVLSEMHRRAYAGDGNPLGKSPMQEEKIMTAEECASKIVTALENRERLLIMSGRGKVGRWIKLVAPGLIDRVARKAIREAK